MTQSRLTQTPLPCPPPYPQPKDSRICTSRPAERTPGWALLLSAWTEWEPAVSEASGTPEGKLPSRPTPPAHTQSRAPFCYPRPPPHQERPRSRQPAPSSSLFFSPLSQAMPASFTWAVMPSIMDTASTSVTCTTKRSCGTAQLSGSTSLSPPTPHTASRTAGGWGPRTGHSKARSGHRGRFSPQSYPPENRTPTGCLLTRSRGTRDAPPSAPSPILRRPFPPPPPPKI